VTPSTGRRPALPGAGPHPSRGSLIRLAPVALAVALAACGAGTTDSLPGVAGVWGRDATLTFGDQEAPTDLTVDVLEPGDGTEISAGDYVVAHYIGQVWGADEPFNDSFTGGQPAGFSLDMVIQGWREGLPGTHVGDRVLLSVPSELGYPDGNEDAGIAGGDTLVFVIDLLGAFGADTVSAQPDARETGEAAGLPVTVGGELGGPATVQVKAGSAPPTEVSTTTIAEGDGEPVGGAGTVVVSFAATGWDGTPGGSTWDLGAPEAIRLGAGTVFDDLVGRPVGSRVVTLIPASGGTPAIAAVVDIVGWVPPVE